MRKFSVTVKTASGATDTSDVEVPDDVKPWAYRLTLQPVAADMINRLVGAEWTFEEKK
jgi:hypothetical protein